MEELRRYAKELLVSGEVAAVIGYMQVSETRTKPVIIIDPTDTSLLVLNEYCLNNLTVYLTRARIKALAREKDKVKKLAVVVKPCDERSIVALIQENQIRRDELVIISFNCHGVVRDFGCSFVPDTLAAKCSVCTSAAPQYSDKIFGEVKEIPGTDDKQLMKIDETGNKSAAERF